MTKKIREIRSPGPSSPIGQARKELYKLTLERIDHALEDDYALEAVTLLESLICDRLEARIASIHAQKPEKRKLSNLGPLTNELKGKKSNEPEEAKAVYQRINNWSQKRNEVLHQLAKLSAGSSETWEDKYQSARNAAASGKKLFRELCTITDKLNRPASS